MRVLLVEDDVELARRLAAALAEAGYAVDHAVDGVDAEFRGQTETYDAADQHVEGVRVGVDAVFVHVLAEFGAAHHRVAAMYQVREDPVFLRGQRQRRVVQREAAGVVVER